MVVQCVKSRIQLDKFLNKFARRKKGKERMNDDEREMHDVSFKPIILHTQTHARATFHQWMYTK